METEDETRNRGEDRGGAIDSVSFFFLLFAVLFASAAYRAVIFPSFSFGLMTWEYERIHGRENPFLSSFE